MMEKMRSHDGIKLTTIGDFPNQPSQAAPWNQDPYATFLRDIVGQTICHQAVQSIQDRRITRFPFSGTLQLIAIVSQ
jgi:hypothetical protein